MEIGRAKDIRGNKYGRLTVKERAEDYVCSNGKHVVQWLCECECGKEIVVRGNSLKTGNTKSCGCLQQAEDLTGRRFGKYTVLCRADNHINPCGHTNVMFLCECDCGMRRVVPANDLRKGNCRSCGCRRFTESRKGQRFGRLEVISDRKIKDVDGRGKWLCQCDCGNMCLVRTSSLTSGFTRSCGCLLAESSKARMTGPNNPNWKDGVTSFARRVRGVALIARWREQVFERDKYVCQKCGQKGGQLEAHHIKAVHKILEENCIDTIDAFEACEEVLDVSNGITLCERCHSGIKSDNPKAFHKQYGKVGFTVEDFYKWLEREVNNGRCC